MGWDVVLIKTATNDEPVEELDETLPFEREAFWKAAKKMFPEALPDEGLIRGEGYAIEVALDGDEAEAVTLSVRTDDGDPGEALRFLCGELGCRAMDAGAGEFIEFD